MRKRTAKAIDAAIRCIIRAETILEREAGLLGENDEDLVSDLLYTQASLNEAWVSSLEHHTEHSVSKSEGREK